MNERGGSLVELCTVVAIIAIVTGVSLPGWAALVGRHQQRAVVKEIASELRMARQLAMARHERIRVVVNAEQSVLRTECVDCGTGPLRRYAFAGRGTAIESMTTKPEIMFQPSGRSATATTMVLVDRRHVTHQVTVSITGRVALL
ncbi:MAG: GspH/FimT family pseudopilin [Nitrospira sp.]|nr:GspH/FimT family pseudopilin [Nitrospira sp.]